MVMWYAITIFRISNLIRLKEDGLDIDLKEKSLYEVGVFNCTLYSVLEPLPLTDRSPMGPHPTIRLY